MIKLIATSSIVLNCLVGSIDSSKYVVFKDPDAIVKVGQFLDYCHNKGYLDSELEGELRIYSLDATAIVSAKQCGMEMPYVFVKKTLDDLLFKMITQCKSRLGTQEV